MMTDLKIACSKCLAINRVSQSRLQEAPNCGKCHLPLFSGEPLELTDANFQKLISASSQPILVLFWAPWCGYCQKTLPEFKRSAAGLEPSLRLARLNTETSRATASRYAVNSLPTLIIFNQRKEIARQLGAMDSKQIIGWAKSQKG